MIKILKSKNGQFYFTVCTRNGKVLTTSETYISRRNVKRAIASHNLLMLRPLKIIDKT